MHRPFKPIPDWLDPAHNSAEPLFPAPETAEFLVVCFETLYNLGMSDRQVVELTSLLICLSKRNRFHVPFCFGGPSALWYLDGSRFFRCFSSLSEKVVGWVGFFLPKNDKRASSVQAFWAVSKEWPRGFFDDQVEFDREVERTRNKFVQMFFGLNPTGTWDIATMRVVKRFQDGLPKCVLPWKTGALDGFTFKFIANIWRKRRGV